MYYASTIITPSVYWTRICDDWARRPRHVQQSRRLFVVSINCRAFHDSMFTNSFFPDAVLWHLLLIQDFILLELEQTHNYYVGNGLFPLALVIYGPGKTVTELPKFHKIVICEYFNVIFLGISWFVSPPTRFEVNGMREERIRLRQALCCLKWYFNLYGRFSHQKIYKKSYFDDFAVPTPVVKTNQRNWKIIPQVDALNLELHVYWLSNQYASSNSSMLRL